MALIAHVVVLTWQPGVTDDEVERIGLFEFVERDPMHRGDLGRIG